VQAAQVTKYSLRSRYNVPIGDPAVEKLTLAGTVEQRDLGDVTTHTLSVGRASPRSPAAGSTCGS